MRVTIKLPGQSKRMPLWLEGLQVRDPKIKTKHDDILVYLVDKEMVLFSKKLLFALTATCEKWVFFVASDSKNKVLIVCIVIT